MIDPGKNRWIERRIQQRQEEAKKRGTLERDIGRLWTTLVEELNTRAIEYTRLWPQHQVDQPKDVAADPEKIVLAVKYHDSMQRIWRECIRVAVTLSSSVHQILVRYSKETHGITSVSLELGLNQSSKACVRDTSGTEISIEEAAYLILDPLLFEDLPPESRQP